MGPSLTSALDGGRSSFSHPGHFTPWERGPRSHGIGCWVRPRASLDAMEKKSLALARNP
jgi:hypothetical protein